MRCTECPMKASIQEQDRLSFYCRVNRVGITAPGPAEQAIAALDRPCQFPDFVAAVRPYIHRRRSELLKETAELHRQLAAREDQLATLDAIEAEVIT